MSTAGFPLWLNGAHPTELGETVDAQICMNDGNGNECYNPYMPCCYPYTTIDIKIKKCDGFFIYELDNAAFCQAVYCAV